MLQQLSKVRYEERKHSYDKAGVLDEQYKERIHNIKYYMKQITHYKRKSGMAWNWATKCKTTCGGI